MREYLTFYIGGQWVEPATAQTIDVINPATERVCGKVAAGSAEDVDRAVAAARGAFETWSATTVADRLAVLRGVAAEYQCRRDDLAAALTEEMGAPAALAGGFQVDLGAGHLDTAIAALAEYSFEQRHGASQRGALGQGKRDAGEGAEHVPDIVDRGEPAAVDQAQAVGLHQWQQRRERESPDAEG